MRRGVKKIGFRFLESEDDVPVRLDLLPALLELALALLQPVQLREARALGRVHAGVALTIHGSPFDDLGCKIRDPVEIRAKNNNQEFVSHVFSN